MPNDVPSQKFSRSPIPGLNDANALAQWNGGQDPREVVLPLCLTAAWAYADKSAFDMVMARRGLSSAPSHCIEVMNPAMFVTATAYVQPVGDGAILAFRGTDPTNLINWLADATLQKVAFHAKPGVIPHGYVHSGFYRNTRAIWPEVVEYLAGLQPRWIYITGHSFGAALALLAGALLADYKLNGHESGYGELWDKTKGIFTFGQPMVGDEAFAKSFQPIIGNKLVRFVYEHDIVPHLPPKTDGWTPVHFGEELWSDGTKWTRQTTPTRPVPAAVRSNLVAVAAWIKDQMGFAPRLTLPYSWGDHAPNNYVRVSLPQGADSGSEFD